MGYLIATVVLAASLSIVFKGFTFYKIRNFHAIIINYFVCFIIGMFFFDLSELTQLLDKDWILPSSLLSLSFIVGFSLFGITIANFGVAMGVIMQKMSLIISVALSIYLYSESITINKITGVLFGVFAIFLSTNKVNALSTEFSPKKVKFIIFIPILLLLVSTTVDLGLQFIEKTYIDEDERHLFNSVLFLGAALIGLTWLVVKNIKTPQEIPFTKDELIGGVVLGIPNYFSIYFLIQSFATGIEGSILFPLINVSIILFSIILSYLIFKEKIDNRKKIGIALACISILFISMSF